MAGLCSLFMLFSACSNHSDSNSGKSPNQALDQGVVQVGLNQAPRIIDENGQPISGAQVLIGMSQGQPLANNFLTTGKDGHFAAPAGWTTPQTVTVTSPGFVRVSYLAQKPTGQDFIIRHQIGKAQYNLTGTTPGIKPVSGSGICDFSVVIPALRREDLLHFDINKFISPKLDTISILGQDVSIPSNVTLPKQDQSYIFPITIEKPKFTISFDTLGVHKVYAMHGQFPFNDVVDKIRGGSSFYEVINEFNMINGGLVDATIAGPTQSLNIPITSITFDQPVKVQAPSIADDEAILAAAVTEQNGYYIPTDVKQLTSQGQAQLKTMKGAGASKWVSVRKKKDPKAEQTGITAAIADLTAGATPDLLPLLANPTVVSAQEIKVETQSAPSHLEAAATYATLSGLQTTGSGDTAVTTETLAWEVFAPGWVTEIKLPQWPGEAAATGSQRWAVALLGAPVHTPVDLGPALLQAVTHVTRSTQDF
jgi:hypothetical protein